MKTDYQLAVTAISPLVEAYRLWATGRISASQFGKIADPAVRRFDKLVRDASHLLAAPQLTGITLGAIQAIVLEATGDLETAIYVVRYLQQQAQAGGGSK